MKTEHNILCELCHSPTIEGELGEAKYVCQNNQCERFNPMWAKEAMKARLQPYIELKDRLSRFDGGIIELYEARWKGDGSAEITLDNGTTFLCHVDIDNFTFTPFDVPYFENTPLHSDITSQQIEQIKENMLTLIRARNNIWLSISSD